MTQAAAEIPRPIGMLAELTHRCPLRCPYCSNPVELDTRSAELGTDDWKRVFSQAAALGVLHVHLSGGEPTARSDLEEMIAHCATVGLYTNLITAGVNVSADRLRRLADAGLDHVQLSLQAADAPIADRVAGRRNTHSEKLAFAAEVNRLGLPLTVNAVIHRANIHQVSDLIDLAVALGARRLEIAHAQYHGWALRNRGRLIPRREDVMEAVRLVDEARERLAGRLVIDSVLPDYYARFPKACMNGWGRRALNVTPSGKVLPCHAAETIPGLELWNVADHDLAAIWRHSPAFNRFRGTDWMPEPCRSCERREIDWGGCRCQAMAIVGDAAATDPACQKSPHHARMAEVAEAEAELPVGEYAYRSFRRGRSAGSDIHAVGSGLSATARSR